MTGIELWSTTAASNNSAVPNGWPEGMAPSGVNDAARQGMASVRTWYQDAHWINLGYTHTYVAATQFKITGLDVTIFYTVGRRVRAVGSSTGTIYGRISVSAFVTDTTVTVVWDSGTLSNETLTVSLGILVDNSVGSNQIVAASITNAKLANMVQDTFKGRADGAGTGVPVDLTATQAMVILQTTARFKVGSFTRDVTTASGNQAITGVGFVPKAIIILATINATAAMSVGFSDGTTHECLRDLVGLGANTYGPATNLINLLVDGSNFTTADLSSFDSDGFTIAWTKTGSPTGTATLYYLALR